MIASLIEYWTLDQAVNNDDVQVTLFWEDASRSDIVDFTTNDLRVARYDGADWTDEGQASITMSDTGDVTSNVVATYSPFTFGSLNAINPLPVELLDFSVNPQEGWVEINWSTASETNNDFFSVERSSDGLNFEQLLDVKGAGDSDKITNYQASDERPLFGLSYYRLKQTDFDGQFEYSPVVSVFMAGTDDLSVTLSPNPSPDRQFNLELLGVSESRQAIITLRDVAGGTFLEQEVMLAPDQKQIGLNPNTDLPPGIYIINVYLGNRNFTGKLIVQ